MRVESVLAEQCVRMYINTCVGRIFKKSDVTRTFHGYTNDTTQFAIFIPDSIHQLIESELRQ